MDTFEGILFGNAWQTSVTGVLSFSLYARTHEMYEWNRCAQRWVPI